MAIERFEIDTVNRHTITSNVTLCCAETGRVIAVFYNDYDAEALLAAAPRPEAVQHNDFPSQDAGFGGQPLIWEDGPKVAPRPVPTSECPACGGSGKRDYEYGSSDAGWVSGERPCDDCDGTGLVRPAEVKP